MSKLPTLLVLGLPLAALLGAPVAVASEWTTVCAPGRPSSCAAYDGRALWRSLDGGAVWQATSVGPEDGEDSEAETPDEPSDSPSLSEEPAPGADENDPVAAEPRRASIALCVSDKGLIALGHRRRLTLLRGARQVDLRLPAHVQGCVFLGELSLWLETRAGPLRLDTGSLAWEWARDDAVRQTTSMQPAQAGLRRLRAQARRNAAPCPRRAAALLPEVRVRVETWRAAQERLPPGAGTADRSSAWQAFVGVQLRFWFREKAPRACGQPLVSSSALDVAGQATMPRQSDDAQGRLLGALDLWEQQAVARSLRDALAEERWR